MTYDIACLSADANFQYSLHTLLVSQLGEGEKTALQHNRCGDGHLVEGKEESLYANLTLKDASLV